MTEPDFNRIECWAGVVLLPDGEPASTRIKTALRVTWKGIEILDGPFELIVTENGEGCVRFFKTETGTDWYLDWNVVDFAYPARNVGQGDMVRINK